MRIHVKMDAILDNCESKFDKKLVELRETNSNLEKCSKFAKQMTSPSWICVARKYAVLKMRLDRGFVEEQFITEAGITA